MGRCVGLKTLPPSCADYLEILEASTSWKPQGLSRPVMGVLYIILLNLSLLSNSALQSFRKQECMAYNPETKNYAGFY
jgi:hypothetical protein